MTATRSILALLAALSLAGPVLAQTPATGADEAVSTAAHRIDAKAAAEAEKIQAEPARKARRPPRAPCLPRRFRPSW